MRAPVLFVPEIARGFIGHAIGAIAGGAQYRRSSFLLDAVGEKLFPDLPLHASLLFTALPVLI